MPINEKLIIGIDLGTSNSCIGFFNTKTNKIEIIPMTDSTNLYPSRIMFNDGTEIYNIKRFIGQTEINDTLEKEIIFMPYDISCLYDKVLICNGKKTYSPEELSAIILTNMKIRAHEYLKTIGIDHKIKNVVVTVPAHFNDNQKKATINACSMAELNVLGVINEPTAAALSYCLFTSKIDNITQIKNKKHDETTKILIFDLGGGTLDISIIETNKREYFEVLNTIGNVNLGGEDFTNEILVWCLEIFIKENNMSEDDLKKIAQTKKTIQKLKVKIEHAKKQLTTSTSELRVSINNFYKGIELNIVLTQKIFNSVCSCLIDTCKDLIHKILEYGDLEKSEIDEIILVGGATRMPIIKKLLREIFNKNPQCNINPDEAIAYGATVYSAIINGYSKYLNNITVKDITPLTISIKISGNVMIPLIDKNTKIPCSGKKIFETISSTQTTALIQIFQCEDSNNFHKLGECRLYDIIGKTKIEVIVSVDLNNILSLKIKNMSTGKILKTTFVENSIKI